MRSLKRSAAILAPLLLLNACATEPMGPTIPVMPAPGKPFEAFQSDQAVCKQFASGQVQGGAQQANNQQVGTAVIGTLLGAGLGAAVGGGRGAAIGAGAGAIGGTAVGAGPAAQANYSLQQRYDLAYSQCMYSARQSGSGLPGAWGATAAAGLSAAGLCAAWLCAAVRRLLALNHQGHVTIALCQPAETLTLRHWPINVMVGAGHHLRL